MKGWFKLYTTQSIPEANIVKGMLEENEIQVMLLNKVDSSYMSFGEIELYVPAHLKDIARELMNKALMN